MGRVVIRISPRQREFDCIKVLVEPVREFFRYAAAEATQIRSLPTTYLSSYRSSKFSEYLYHCALVRLRNLAQSNPVPFDPCGLRERLRVRND